ncbi:peptidase M24, structural domain-containing protein [Chytridium lagenaria]|nr:peptidase M24, structural domain-containing protein [Chytridium lagenaria]
MDVDERVELDKDNTLTDTVIQKYQTAAAFANDAIEGHPGDRTRCKSVGSLQAWNDFILDQTSKVFTKGNIEKGIAFPTCISVNEVAQCYSPLTDDSLTLKPNDVVKGTRCHIDGYVATLAHTTTMNPRPDQPVTGRAADAICAAYYAAEAAVRAVNAVGKAFDVRPVVGSSSFLMKRFLIESQQEIPNGIDPSFVENDFIFMDNEVYSINIAMSTGAGTLRHSEHKPTVLQRDVQHMYNLKLKASRAALNDITRTFGVFPFSLRGLTDINPGHRLGVQELLNHEIVLGRPVLAESYGEIVAQFKVTLMLTPSGPVRLTAALNPPFVHSEYTVDAANLGEVLKTDVRVAKAKNPVNPSGTMEM